MTLQEYQNGQSKGDYKMAEALCFSCANCNPTLCEWVNNGEEVWSKAEKIDNRDGVIYRVQKCKGYKKLKKRLIIDADMLDVDACEMFAATIISRAIKDYRFHQRQAENPKKRKRALQEMETIRRFFRSVWFGELSDINPEYLIEKLDKGCIA